MCYCVSMMLYILVTVLCVGGGFVVLAAVLGWGHPVVARIDERGFIVIVAIRRRGQIVFSFLSAHADSEKV